MGLETGLKLGQKVITAWTKTGASDSILAMRKVNVNIDGLRLAERFTTDTITSTTMRSEALVSRFLNMENRFTTLIERAEANGYKNIKMFDSLSAQERELLMRNFSKLDDKREFLLTAFDGKPMVFTSAKLNGTNDIIPKLKSDKFDVISGFVEFPDGSNIENVFILNKKLVSQVLGRNKEFFIKRLNLDSSASVEDIYRTITSKNGLLSSNLISGIADNDLLGMLLGYPKTDTIIFNLESIYNESNKLTGMERLDFRNNLPKFKKEIIKLLYSNKSPYKNMSLDFKKKIEQQIRAIEKIQPTWQLLGEDGCRSSYFISYCNNPIEMSQLANLKENGLQNFERALIS